MARITVEDCIEKVSNRFQLVQMAAIRAKQLKRGASSLVPNDENKEVVTALREIAAGVVKPDESDRTAMEPAPQSAELAAPVAEAAAVASTPEAAAPETEEPPVA